MKRSLNKKFAIIFLSALSVLLVVMLFVVQGVMNLFTQDYIEDDIFNTHKAINSSITDVLNEVNYGYTRVSQSAILEQLATDKSQQTFLQLVDYVALSGDYVNFVLAFDGNVFATNPNCDLPTASFVQQIRNSTNIIYTMPKYGDDYLMVGRRLSNVLYDVDGYCVFYLSMDVLNDMCAITDQQLGYTMLVTDDHGIVASGQIQLVGSTIMEKSKYVLQNNGVQKNKIDNVKCIVVSTQLDSSYNWDLYVVSVLNEEKLTQAYITLSWVLVAVSAVCFLVVLFVALRTAKTTVAPINQLSNKISSVDFQNHHAIFGIGEEGDELFELEKSYDEMIRRLFQLMDQNKENMEIQRKLEIDALQMQINPHFLYNTLDAIAWMAKIKKQAEIEKLVINLAKFFRLSLHKGDKYIYLKEETELIEHFLEIERIRFPNTINYQCSLPDGVGEYKTLKLILQPIVENCIKHGFDGKEGVGTITISAKSVGEDIFIDVSDNGCGFDVPQNFLTQKTSKTGGGYGLYNVNERIRLEYGEGYGLSVISQVGVGTTVTVKIKKSL